MTGKATVYIIGHVGKDCEGRYTPAGKPVSTFPVCASRKYNQDGEKREESTWFRVTCWGKLAEIANEYVKKGMLVSVEGRLTPDDKGNPRIWDDKDGNPHALFEVTCNELLLLGGGKNAKQHPAEDTDEMPF